MSTIGAVSYALCALAYGLFTLLLAPANWRGQAQGMMLTAACAATALWAGLITWSSICPTVPAIWIELAEVVRTGLWLGFLVWLLAPLRADNLWTRVLSAFAVLGPVSVICLVLWLRLFVQQGLEPLAAGVPGQFVIAGLVLGLLGLILLEQLYRNMPADRRWAMRYLCLGLGVLFGYDIYLYSDALLFRQLDSTTWFARGAVQALAVPLIALAAKRNQSWSVQVFVSRHVAFHTATVVGVGGYLLLMSIGGYYIRDFSGSWGGFAQILLIAMAAIGLIVVLSSKDARALLRVFLSKHFFDNKYDYRKEWLHLTHRLAEDNDAQTAYERAVHVVADIVNSPAGCIWRWRDGSGFTAVGGWRLKMPESAMVPEDAPLITFLRKKKWIIDMEEYHANPTQYDEMRLPDFLQSLASAWVIVPLFMQETLTGFIVFCRPDVNSEITWEDRDLLKALGSQVANYLGQHENAQALSEARQFEAFNQLTAFLMHDLKNLIAQQSLIVKNAEKHKHNPAFIDDAMSTIGHSVHKMERLLEHLQRRKSQGLIQRVDVHQAINEALRRCSDRLPHPTLALSSANVLVEAEPDAFTMVLIHLIRNAQDATPDNGSVQVSTKLAETSVIIEVADTGTGMTADFIRDELFRPFHSTKSSKGMGIGAYQVREFVHRAGGRVNVHSEIGQGATFSCTLPALMATDEGAATPHTTAETNSL